jgi:hypothetical protein
LFLLLSQAPQCDESAAWKGIRAELQRAGLLEARVEAELAEGARYWRLERSLCRGVLELKVALHCSFLLSLIYCIRRAM